MKKENIAKLKMALSMFVFGTLALFVRKINITAGELALYRAVISTLFIGTFLVVSKQRFILRENKRDLLFLLLSGAAIGFNWMLLFEAYKYTSVSNATLSYYFAPMIVAIVCPLLFKEKLSGRQIFCFIMSTLGVFMIIGTAGGGKRDIIGIIFGLGAAVLYATVVLMNKFIKSVTGIHRTLFQFLSAGIILLPYVAFSDGISLEGLDFNAWINLLLVGIVHTGITYCMYFSALKELSGQKVAILSYIDPLVAVLISVVLLNEKIRVLQFIGGLLILGFTLWSELPTKKSQ